MIAEILPPEIWKPVVGFDGFYEVSSLGRVRRHPNAAPPRRGRNTKGDELRPDGTTGYLRVSLHKQGKLYRECVHRLVAKAFLGGVPRQHVNHIDGNKRNNRLENLEWATPRENVRHAWRIGLCTPNVGEDSGKSKLFDRDIIVIRSAAARGISQRLLASIFQVTEANISSVVRGQTWTHITPPQELLA